MDRATLGGYAHLSWGEALLDLPNYPEICVEKSISYMDVERITRVFDVGCGLGRSSFELARYFDEVTAIDPSSHMIRDALKLKESGRLLYEVLEEGEIMRKCEVELNRFGLVHASKKVNFWQADPSMLKPLFRNYDLIFSLLLLERIPDPVGFLKLLSTRVVKGGYVVLGTAYGWNGSITPKERWVGGYLLDGKAYSSFKGIENILMPDFRLLACEDIPLLFYKHAREYTYMVTQLSIWERV